MKISGILSEAGGSRKDIWELKAFLYVIGGDHFMKINYKWKKYKQP